MASHTYDSQRVTQHNWRLKVPSHDGELLTMIIVARNEVARWRKIDPKDLGEAALRVSIGDDEVILSWEEVEL